MHKPLILTLASLLALASVGQAAERVNPSRRIGLTTVVVKKTSADTRNLAAAKFVAPKGKKQVKAKGFHSTAQLVNVLLGFEDSPKSLAVKVRINQSR